MDSRLFTPEAVSGWQAIQDSLSGMTELELGVYDADGRLGLISGESPFCADIKASGQAAAHCDQWCADFVRQTLRARPAEPRFDKCPVGQKVFAVRLGEPGDDSLVLCGGKTFETRSEHAGALSGLEKLGVKVQKTGRHRYRFVGRRRLEELTGLVGFAANQYFNLSSSASRYRLKLNRQAALVENASLLYQVDDAGNLVDGFMRALEMLFGLERLSVHLFAIGRGETDGHFMRGAALGEVVAHADRFMDWLGRWDPRKADSVLMDEPGLLEGAGFAAGVASVYCMPIVISGEILGAVNIYGAELSAEDRETLRAYAQQMAIAIDNRRLRTGVMEKLNRLKAMTVLSSSAGNKQDPDEIYRLLLDKSTELLKAERGSLMIMNERTDELFIKASKGIAADVLRMAASKKGEGIAGGVAKSGAPVVVTDAATEPRPGVSGRPDYKTGSFVSVPLKVRGRVVGVVNLTDRADGETFDHDDMEFLLGLASYAGAALEGTLFDGRTGELDDIRVHDEATGLLTWSHFNSRLAEEVERARRYGRGFSLMLLDIDGFERYRQENGTRAVEVALGRISALLGSSLRTPDIASRYSEDRMAVVLPETPESSAVAIAERFRRRVEAARFPDGSLNDGRRLTVSIGVSEYPEDAGQPRGLFEAAADALALAKKAGENTVCTAKQGRQ